MVVNEIAKYDAATQTAMRDEHVSQLNPEQRAVYDSVMAAVDHRAFFVDGLGGTGKTFLYSCLLSIVRAQGRVTIAVASFGIAALLLDEGRTAHSRFKIPVQGLNSTSTCYINRDPELAALLQAAALIVWDEAVMMHRHVFEAVNRFLQDIMAVINPAFKFLPFGGLVVVFGGDFRQILPVVPRGRHQGRCCHCSFEPFQHMATCACIQVAHQHARAEVVGSGWGACISRCHTATGIC